MRVEAEVGQDGDDGALLVDVGEDVASSAAGTREDTLELAFLRKALASDEFRASRYYTKFAEVLAKRP